MLTAMTLLILVSAFALPSIAATHFVMPDGSGDFPTIQSAIEAATDGDAIELGDGIFRGPGNRDLNLHGKELRVRSRSGNAAACVLDCEGSSSEPHRAWFFTSAEEGGARLESFTMRNGYSISNGAACYYSFAARVTIHDCRFEGNVAEDHGGAVYAGPGAIPIIRESVFSGNRARNGGGICLATREGGAGIDRCLLEDNIADERGGGLCCLEGTSPLVTWCSFERNRAGERGGGAYCEYDSRITLQDCRFIENATDLSGGGFACWQRCYPVIERCLFEANSARDAGGLMSIESSPLIRETTFAYNTAAERGGGIFCDGFIVRDPVVEATTFVWNRATTGGGAWLHLDRPVFARFSRCLVAFSESGEAIHITGNYSIPAIECCDLYGNEGGDWVGFLEDYLGSYGNIRADPLLCGDENPEVPFSLRGDSPCARENYPMCDGIGAWPIGCEEPTSTRIVTWGGIRMGYR
ncbi:MAG: hypothetical protein GF346_04500 [Candidatus Eisenbacteria bacterium]|nr:hypothetical protein [Candidatus Latescibacterota bacterium]MBD3301688.1 hypothetical protein [Candidatus Eisenbacteria bacterium]